MLFLESRADQEALIQRLEPEPSDSLCGRRGLLSQAASTSLGTALGRGASVREALPREGCNPRATVGDCARQGPPGEHREHPQTSSRWPNRKPC